MADSGNTSVDSDLLPRMLKEHVALVVALMVAILTAYRILQVAHGNVTTALGILQHSGTADVTAGVLLATLPIAVLGCVVAASLYGLLPGKVATPLAVVALLTVVPLGMLLLTSIGAGLALALVAAVRRLARDRIKGNAGAKLTLYLLVAFIAVLLATDDNWMALEQVTVAGRHNPVVGYVLNESDSGAVLLSETDRTIVLLDRPLTTRKVCRPAGHGAAIRLLVPGEDGRRWPDLSAFGFWQELTDGNDESISSYPRCEE